MDKNLIILATSFFISNIIGAIAGFGSVMVGLAFASLWLPIDSIPPIVMPVDCLTYGFVFWKSREFLDRNLLFKIVLPLSFAGLLIGQFLAPHIPTNALRTAFGFFVLFFGVSEMLKELSVRAKTVKAPTRLQAFLFLVSGGIMQGVFGSGGVMIVGYMSRRTFDKRVFRATLAALWVLLNFALIAGYFRTNRVNSDTMKCSMVLLPVVSLAVLIGDRIHQKVSQQTFRRLVFSILCLAGFSLIFH